MPRIKKAEREAVEAALMHAQDDLKAASEGAIEALDSVRMQHLSKPGNRPYVILMQQEGQPLVYTYGPYETLAQAQKAQRGLACPGPAPCRSVIQRLIVVPS